MKSLFILCGLLCLNFTGFSQEIEPKKVQYPNGFTEQLNVVYTKVGDWEGKLDLYLPAPGKAPGPVLINVHGGGWNKGTKESQTGFSRFFKNGYAVANIEYRLTGVATAPAAIEDTRCALIYIIKNAKKLNIDPNKIVIMGGSAGGHLALMAGLLENNPVFDTNCKSAAPVKVAAIIDKYGITDVWDWAYGPIKTSKSATSWLGAKAKDDAFTKSVSPLYQVKKTSPPTFIVHGDADPTVPYQQSIALKEQFDKMGVKSELVIVKDGLHGKFPKEDNSMVDTKIMDFLKSLGL